MVLSAVLALAAKDLKLLLRDRAQAFFTLFFPVLVAIFFGYVFRGMYGNDDDGARKLDIAVVNLDGGPASLAFAADLAGDDSLAVHPAPTRDAGEDLVRKKKVAACVVIPKGFEESSGALFAGRTLEIEAVVDPTRGAEGGLLTGKLNEIAFRQIQRSFSDPATLRKTFDNARAALAGATGLTDAQRSTLSDMFDGITRAADSLDERPGGAGASATAGPGGWRPIAVTVHALESRAAGAPMPTSSYAVSFPQGVVWGLVGCVMAFAVSLSTERASGTLMRLTTAPIGKATILAGKALACFVACLAVQALLLLLAVGPFGVRVPDWPLMAVVVVLTSFGFTGLMMLLAGLARTEGAAQGLGRAVVLVLAIIGGGSIPLFLLPRGAQLVSRISPFSWATLSIEGVLWRGYTPTDLLLPGAVLVGFGVGGFVLGVAAMRWSDSG